MGTVAGGGSDSDRRSPGILSMAKEPGRIIPPTLRPDGTLRKPVRIRPGYTPPDEVPKYQTKGALMMKGAQLEYPPGYDPGEEVGKGKMKSKSAKRNERKKEKKQQAALTSPADTEHNVDLDNDEKAKSERGPSAQVTVTRLESVESVTNQIGSLSIFPTPEVPGPSIGLAEGSKLEDSGPEIDKRIRALKKKIRLVDVQSNGDQQHMKPELSEKMARVEGWRQELKLLEDKRTKILS